MAAMVLMLPRGCDSAGPIERSFDERVFGEQEDTPEHPFRVKT